MKYKSGDIVLVRSSAGACIQNIHVKLLKRVVVKPTKGKQVGMRRTMDWPGYSGWEATPVYQIECDILRTTWSIPFTKPGEDITFVYDENIVKKPRNPSPPDPPRKKKSKVKTKRKPKRRIVRKPK